MFGRTRLPGGQAAYWVRICAPTNEIDAGTFTLRVPYRLDVLAEADTIILPGLADPTVSIPNEVLVALRNSAARGARIASICGGAFILAATGLPARWVQPPTGLHPASWHDNIPKWMSMPMCSSSIMGSF
nr:hypothetical protein [Ktedonobacter racemifer]